MQQQLAQVAIKLQVQALEVGQRTEQGQAGSVAQQAAPGQVVH